MTRDSRGAEAAPGAELPKKLNVEVVGIPLGGRLHASPLLSPSPVGEESSLKKVIRKHGEERIKKHEESDQKTW